MPNQLYAKRTSEQKHGKRGGKTQHKGTAAAGKRGSGGAGGRKRGKMGKVQQGGVRCVPVGNNAVWFSTIHYRSLGRVSKENENQWSLRELFQRRFSQGAVCT